MNQNTKAKKFQLIFFFPCSGSRGEARGCA